MGEVWDREKRIDAEAGERYRKAIRDFISQYHKGTLSFLMTTRKNGLPMKRPVSTLLGASRPPTKYLTIYSGTFWLLISLGISWHIPEKMVQNFRPGT